MSIMPVPFTMARQDLYSKAKYDQQSSSMATAVGPGHDYLPPQRTGAIENSWLLGNRKKQMGMPLPKENQRVLYSWKRPSNPSCLKLHNTSTA